MELLLINHPLDCPVCDKGGECPLQNQAMSNGRARVPLRRAASAPSRSRSRSPPRSCSTASAACCARAAPGSPSEIAGDPFIELLERGALQQVGIDEDEPFESYFSGNTIQICPVGALTSAAYRFRVPAVRPGLDADGLRALRLRLRDAHRPPPRQGHAPAGRRRPEVNEEWNCDKGRFAFRYVRARRPAHAPAGARRGAASWSPASWPEALDARRRGLPAARDAAGVGVLAGGRLTLEDAYAYAKFARVALGTNDIDFRAGPHSAEEADFLAQHVAGSRPGRHLRRPGEAPAVLLVGLEPEEESPIVFLRLRKARAQGRHRGPRHRAVRHPRPGEAVAARCCPPPRAPRPRSSVPSPTATGGSPTCGDALQPAGAVILVGERLGAVPGALSAALRLADGHRRPAGLDPAPGRRARRARGRRAARPAARRPPGRRRRGAGRGRRGLGRRARCRRGPAATPPGSSPPLAAGKLAGARRRRRRARRPARPGRRPRALDGRAVRGQPRGPRAARSPTLADVVLPVAPVAEKAGTFVNWEGRARPFPARARRHRRDARPARARTCSPTSSTSRSACRRRCRPRRARRARRLGRQPGRSADDRRRRACRTRRRRRRPCWPPGGCCSTTGRLQDGEPLPGRHRTAAGRPAVRRHRRRDRRRPTASCSRSARTPARSRCRCAVTEMPDRVVWVPPNSPGSPGPPSTSAPAPGRRDDHARRPRSPTRRRSEVPCDRARPGSCAGLRPDRRASATTPGGSSCSRPSPSSCSCWC